MPFVADVHADVVQDCGVLQPVALAVAERDACCESGRTATERVAPPGSRAPASSGSARRARSRCGVGCRDSARPARSACGVSRCNRGSSPSRNDRSQSVSSSAPSRSRIASSRTAPATARIRPSWIEAGYSQPLFERQRRKVFADPVQLLQRRPVGCAVTRRTRGPARPRPRRQGSGSSPMCRSHDRSRSVQV